MSIPNFLKVQHLKRISETFDDEILSLETQVNSLKRQLQKERLQNTRQSFRIMHGSVDIHNFLKLDVLKYPLVEKEELKKLANEYNKTVNLYGQVSNSSMGRNLDKLKSKFDE